MNGHIVVTTIRPKSEALEAFERIPGWHTLVVGDRKTPAISSSASLTFISLEEQARTGFELVSALPLDHYARKNLGYLCAMARGADLVYDSDDDNFPCPDWHPPEFACGRALRAPTRFVNVYRLFTDAAIWPRGFPLDEILRPPPESDATDGLPVRIGIWQGLTHGDPDADAIYWLTSGRPVRFRAEAPLFLPPGSYCPVNSQNTFWHRDAFPYLYLPATVSFRFTDILRGYVAQRLLWTQGLQVGFIPGLAVQRRNPHDAMTDFHDEMTAYLHVRAIADRLLDLEWTGSPCENLRRAYRELRRMGIVAAAELPLVDSWIADYRRITGLS